jgi:hypothetical protein
VVQALGASQSTADFFFVYTEDGTAQRVVIDISGRDDAPTLTGPSATQSALEETAFVFSTANGNAFSLSDPDSANQTVTLSSGLFHGTFSLARLDGLTFAVGDGSGDETMTFSGSIANLNAALDGMSYTGSLNFNGGVFVGVSAGSGSLTDNHSLQVVVNPVNDAPSGGSLPASISEGSVLVFAPAASGAVVGTADQTPQFVFSDPQDSPVTSLGGGSNSFAGLVVTTLPTAGTLTNHGSEVTAGQFISKDDLNQGQFHFVPDANGTGSPYASFTFQMRDDGGVANGGIDLDPTPNAMVISVNAVPHVNGTPGGDLLSGVGVDDILIGGAGSDTLNGSFGADVFRWGAGDQGAPAPTDVVNGFSPTIAPKTDALDLRDLLVGETQSTLGDYLDFSFGGGSTTIDVRSAGASGPVDQHIVLNGVDLSPLGSEGAIIAALVTSGKLITD